MVLLSFIAFIIVCIAVDGIVQIVKRRKAALLDAASFQEDIFDENSISVPKGIYFAKSHTWAFMDLYGGVKIGINDFLQHVTGSVTRLEFKNTGDKITKGEPCLTVIQNGKHITLNAPVTGIIKNQNTDLLEKLSLINSSPYTDGWIYTIEPSNWLKETQLLMMADKATDWIKKEYSRFKDFLSSSVQMKEAQYVYTVFQDGGTLKDNTLADLGPEVWDDFQTKFLDTNK